MMIIAHSTDKRAGYKLFIWEIDSQSPAHAPMAARWLGPIAGPFDHMSTAVDTMMQLVDAQTKKEL